MGQTGSMAPAAADDLTGPAGSSGRRLAHLGAPGGAPTAVVPAPAKLTVSLRITGVRADGYHLLDAEMVSLDLCDELRIEPGADGLVLVDEVVGGLGLGDVDDGPGNLVRRALAATGRRARVTLVKRIPARAGLGGGSADAGAVLRWAGVTDPAVGAGLGADVPFCVRGGRARVGGVGEELAALPFVARAYVLLLPPLGVDTVACYQAWDRLQARGGAQGADDARNDLLAPALQVAPELARWRDAFGERTGCCPQLAGSGSTWFVEGTPESLGLGGVDHITVDGRRGTLVPVRTVPAMVLPAGETPAGETPAG